MWRKRRQDLAAWFGKWSRRYPIVPLGGGLHRRDLSFYCLPRQHHQNEVDDMLERLTEEIKRRTLIVRIFPNRRLSGDVARLDTYRGQMVSARLRSSCPRAVIASSSHVSCWLSVSNSERVQ